MNLPDISMEKAKLLKEEGLFMGSRPQDESVAARKGVWKATGSGQRLIELKEYALVTKTMLESIKNRIFSKIY